MSNQLEIPEISSEIESRWRADHDGGVHGYRVIDDREGVIASRISTNELARYIALAPAMAAEIKRLRVELSLAKASEAAHKKFTAQLQTEIKYLKQDAALPQTTREDRAFQCLQGLLANSQVDPSQDLNWAVSESIHATEAMLAALAKPQKETVKPSEIETPTHPAAGEPLEDVVYVAGVGLTKLTTESLPAGCDPFNLERAKKEGAMTAEGEIWKWDGGDAQSDGDGWCFESEKDHWWFNAQGIAEGAVDAPRLYCIARPARRPFDLAAALRGEKVVTNTGKKVTGFRKRIDDGHDIGLFPYEGLVEGFPASIVFDGEGLSAFPHFTLFMEGAV